MFEFGPRRLAIVVAIVALTIRGAAQVIATKGGPPGPRTAMIVGQVVDATTGAPVPEAIVTLAVLALRESERRLDVTLPVWKYGVIGRHCPRPSSRG